MNAFEFGYAVGSLEKQSLDLGQLGGQAMGALNTVGSTVMNRGGQALGAAGKALGAMGTQLRPMVGQAPSMVGNALDTAGRLAGQGGVGLHQAGKFLQNPANIARYGAPVGAGVGLAAGGALLGGMATNSIGRAAGNAVGQQPGPQKAANIMLGIQGSQEMKQRMAGMKAKPGSEEASRKSRFDGLQASIAPQAKRAFAPMQTSVMPQQRPQMPSFFQQQVQKRQQDANEQANQKIRGGVGKVFGQGGQQVYDKGVQLVGHAQNAWDKMKTQLPRPTGGNI